MGACARNMQSDSAEIKPAQYCIKLLFSFNLYYDARKHKIKIHLTEFNCSVKSPRRTQKFVLQIHLYCYCVYRYTEDSNSNNFFQITWSASHFIQQMLCFAAVLIFTNFVNANPKLSEDMNMEIPSYLSDIAWAT